jgi:hypothetical protein
MATRWGCGEAIVVTEPREMLQFGLSAAESGEGKLSKKSMRN